MILNLHKVPKIGDSCSPTRIFRLSNALVPSNRSKIRPSRRAPINPCGICYSSSS